METKIPFLFLKLLRLVLAAIFVLHEFGWVLHDFQNIMHVFGPVLHDFKEVMQIYTLYGNKKASSST
jgi:FtsH-binding integral membrane protein